MTLFEDFLKYLRYELNYSVHTVLSYSIDLRQFVIFLSCGNSDASLADNDIEVAKITNADVRAWIVSLGESSISSRSIHRKFQALRALFRYALKIGAVEVDPCEGVDLAKVKPVLPSYVRPEAMNELLDCEYDNADFKHLRDRLIVEMLYDTGIRRSELVGLLDRNVDTSKGEIKVLGKRNKERIIPIGEILCRMIDEYRTVRSAEVGQVEEFFVRENGLPIYPNLVYNKVKRWLGATGVAKRSPHVLRHSFASAMLNDGAEINSVKELLGHQSLAATQIYTHITISELKHNYQQAHPRAAKKGG